MRTLDFSGTPTWQAVERSHHVDAAKLEGLQRWASELRALEEQLRAEEQELVASEALLDKQLSEAESKKRMLLTTLKQLSYDEEDLKEREARVAEEEGELRSRHEEIRARQRELTHQQHLLDQDIADREAKLLIAKKKAAEKAQENQKVVQRLRQQHIEAEDRLRSLEMQLQSRCRVVDDLEREVQQSYSRQRDAEIAAIEELKADIERRKALLGHQAM
jgi:chromosome segregation ATPase